MYNDTNEKKIKSNDKNEPFLYLFFFQVKQGHKWEEEKRKGHD